MIYNYMYNKFYVVKVLHCKQFCSFSQFFLNEAEESCLCGYSMPFSLVLAVESYQPHHAALQV